LIVGFKPIEGLFYSIEEGIQINAAILKQSLQYTVGTFSTGSDLNAKVAIVLDRVVGEFKAERKISITKVVNDTYN
jgi:hypothetical protein